MLSPLSVELFAQDVIRTRLAQATQDALAHQLPRPATVRPDAVARQFLASGLRALAARLDPCLAPEAGLVVLRTR